MPFRLYEAIRSRWSRLKGRRVRLLGLLLLLALSGYLLYLDIIIRDAFEGRRFALPARVYARALELYPGVKLAPEDFAAELRLLAYRGSPEPGVPGTFRRTRHGFEVTTREFAFWDGPQAPRPLRLGFDDGRLVRLQDLGTGEDVALARLDPPLIGGIYPGENEDRVLVKSQDVPRELVNALLAIEDRQFYSHIGLDPRGIARALFTIATGGSLQGGSTITQQLVKNFFLTSERTVQRKFTEMLMALLLELHYEKDDILETYLNEVYLGQDANRAIHGFGLASYFYFDRPLEQLELHEQALLVALVKGPSHYHPRRHPERARERRDLVLQEMARQELITQERYVAEKHKPLEIVAKAPVGTSPHPAFLNLVHRQLRRDYDEDDLRSEGLRIFTTLDPRVQEAAEQAIKTRLAQIEKARRLPPDMLEGAAIVTSTQTGEVLAVVGGRDPRFAGFNRALDAARPVGSLVKPVVYLAALEHPDRFTLATLLDDSRLVHRERGADDWIPENYDKSFHGQVALRTALAQSYNLATVRLGLAVGVRDVMRRVERLGVEHELPPFASGLLGSFELAPIEVAQLYQTLADGGFRTPLRAIREVAAAEGKPLQRYPLRVEQVAAAAPVYLLTSALQAVVREGTASALSQYLPGALAVAGKTGTTDGLRDSWFAGFTGDRVAVTWIGRDDNQPTGLTGASGAMTVWGEMMARLDPEPVALPRPERIEFTWIDPATQKRADENCPGAVELPFIAGSAPSESAACARPARKSWFERVFE